MMDFYQEKVLYLSRKDVMRACSEIDSVAVIGETLKAHAAGQTKLPDEAYLAWTNSLGEDVRSINMPGYVGGSFQAAGTKIINGNIHNPLRGLPRASGFTLLYDDASVHITCIMEGGYLSSLRTASVTALAAETLKGNDIRCVALIGAGVLAQAHIELLVRRLPALQRISVFDLERARALALQEASIPLLREHGREMEIASSAEDAIRAAQLIIPVTTTTTGYIRFDWLQPGAILVNISLDDPLPEVVFQADVVIVDDWNLVKNDSRRLLGRMYQAGQIVGPDEPAESAHKGFRRIDAQLGEILLASKQGRRKVDDIILVNPFGLSIEDVALAAQVYRTAQTLGLGTWLER